MQNCDPTRFMKEFSTDVFVDVFSEVIYWNGGIDPREVRDPL